MLAEHNIDLQDIKTWLQRNVYSRIKQLSI